MLRVEAVRQRTTPTIGNTQASPNDECLAPVRAVAHRLEDPDADAPRVERPNERGAASKAERAESRRPGEGAPKYVAIGLVRAHGSMLRVAARPVNARLGVPQYEPIASARSKSGGGGYKG
jgi:hypothetical protein